MRRAFTVIEGLVIAAIIGILASLVITQLNESRLANDPAFYPEPTGYVVDQAGILSDATEKELSSQLKAFDSKAQVAVLTVKTTGPLSIEEYGIKLAEKWKVGYKGKDNGVIFLVASEDRKMRVEVGRGLEGDITDSEAAHVIDAVRPFYKDGKWDQGTKEAVNLITKEIK